MKLQESGEMYLETIHILSGNMSFVRSLDVAEYMGFSKPSVSRAIARLKAEGYVNMAEGGQLTLTESGLKIAEMIYERHQLLSDFLISLGVRKDTAIEDACRMEHYISDETFRAIKRHVKDMGK